MWVLFRLMCVVSLNRIVVLRLEFLVMYSYFSVVVRLMLVGSVWLLLVGMGLLRLVRLVVRFCRCWCLVRFFISVCSVGIVYSVVMLWWKWYCMCRKWW